MASPLQVFMVRMWVSLWNAPSRPLLRVSTWLILTPPCSSLYAPELNHRENLAAVKVIQEIGLKSAHTILLLLRRSSSFLFCVHVCSAYQRSHLFCEKHTLLPSHATVFVLQCIPSNWFFRSGGLRADNSVWLGQLYDQTETWYTQTSCISLFFLACSTTALQLSASPFSYQSIPC